LPGEDVSSCVERELREETGLTLHCVATGFGSEEWLQYVAEAPPDAEVRLDTEHDRFEWVRLEEAAARCTPAFVGQSFRAAAAWLESS
jgi:8-oxo-dGTP pyrophosphatase MutT (NUDIX family)